MRWFFLGIVFVVVVALLTGLALIRPGRGFSAREQPTAMERWVARKARDYGHAGRREIQNESRS